MPHHEQRAPPLAGLRGAGGRLQGGPDALAGLPAEAACLAVKGYTVDMAVDQKDRAQGRIEAGLLPFPFRDRACKGLPVDPYLPGKY